LRASRSLIAHIPDLAKRETSLSHSASYAAFAAAPRPLEIGVDIEKIRPRAFLDMARIAFSEGEFEYLSAIDDRAERSSVFYTLWTLKEAFAKALTLNFIDALRNCVFINSNGHWNAQLPTSRCWRATVFAPRPLLRLALVRLGDPQLVSDTPLETREWPQESNDDWAVVMELGRTSDWARKEC